MVDGVCLVIRISGDVIDRVDSLDKCLGSFVRLKDNFDEDVKNSVC